MLDSLGKEVADSNVTDDGYDQLHVRSLSKSLEKKPHGKHLAVQQSWK
jgi:hypothetical protein